MATTMPHSTTANTLSSSSNDPTNRTESKQTTTTTANASSTSSTRRTNTNTTTTASAHPKRTTVPLADGWTLVSTTRSAPAHTRKKKGKMPSGGGGGGGYSGLSGAGLRAAHEPAGPARVMPGMGKEKLLERLGKFRERWAECGCRVGIREVLGRAGVGEGGGEVVKSVEGAVEEEEQRGGELTIRGAVCIGLGSLSVDNVAAGVRSMWQLVCFLDIVEMLAGGAEAVALYAEDPVFNALDEEILQELGVTVVQGRRLTDGSRQEGAAQYIERDSLVFAPFMPSFMVLEDFLADKDPAIYIGNDVQATLELAKSQVRYR